MKSKIFRNKKKDTLYLFCGHVMNTTNAQDGQIMVRYKSMETGDEYVREHNEFDKKFEPLRTLHLKSNQLEYVGKNDKPVDLFDIVGLVTQSSPILVKRLDIGKYGYEDGRCRVRAAEIFDITIPCIEI